MRTTTDTNGFTLVETLIAITVLVVAVAAPIQLASQSLLAAFFAKDQMIASHLAQEGIEMVRWRRDQNHLSIVRTGATTSWLEGIPSTSGSNFTVDSSSDTLALCPGGVCTPISYNGTVYGYGSGGTWEETRFTREVRVTELSGVDEATIEVTVRWRTGAFSERSFTLNENIYDWVPRNTN